MDQLTYNTTYVKLYLKEAPFAAASLGISSFFLIAFSTYLILFISFILSVKIKHSSWCDNTKEDPKPIQQSTKEITTLSTGNMSHRTSFSSCNNNNQPSVAVPPKKLQQSSMNRNQKIMFFMVICLVLIQILALSVRAVSDILSILIDSSFKQISSGSIIVSDESLRNQISAFFVFASAELGLTFGNMITTLVIMCFVLNVFLTTCLKIGAISPKAFKILQISIISINVIYFVIASSIMLIISVGYLLARLGVVKDFLLAFYISIFLIDVTMIIVETVVFNIYGFKVVSTINQQAVKSQREQKKLCVKRKRFAKIIILQLGLSFCTILQVVAMILQTITRVSGNDIWEIAHYFVNSFGILSFAIVVLMLYNPLLNYTEKTLDRRKKGKHLDGQPSNTESVMDTDSVYTDGPMSPSFMVDNGDAKTTGQQFNQFLTVPGQSESKSNSTSSLISEDCHTPNSLISDTTNQIELNENKPTNE